ncbi:hypothetical protein [Mucilaginibacter xinganensis]|uniref:Uncharacterized protein n=1 Tax=Mucilaginibacter xinganensis TaxID=1234841 RepID=A0A223NZG3_9SPHI|nr:hypothetical protein [Mucilaginibacter xinganensis]ASU35279.1 hypothetical protein MuYL_3394 [Mucilaginibacter xinganensis]
MLKLYYRIWADAIISQKKNKAGNTSWQLYTLVPISALQGINLLTIFYWLRIIVSRQLLLAMPVNIFNAHPLNSFISVLVTFFIPFAILNYLAVFSNERYKQVIETYGSQQGKLYKKYALISIGLLIIPVVIKVMFFE